MDGFKQLPKMQHFKVGGAVKAKAMCWGGKMKKGGEVSTEDVAQDKAMVKKGVRQHESALHKGEPKTELKLKTGGRVKKAVGTVKKFAAAPSKAVVKSKESLAQEKGKPSGHKDPYIKSKESGKKAAAPSGAKQMPNKYKAGGSVSNIYGAKKKSGDLDNIEKTKKITPSKAAAPSKSTQKAAASGTTNTLKKGGKPKRMAVGGQPGASEEQQKYYNKNKAEGDKKAAKADYEAFGSRGDAARKGMEEGRVDAMGNVYKKGGKTKKVKCMADGGLTAEEQAWLGGADANDPIIRARMQQALGTQPAPQGSYIPSSVDNRDVGQTGGSIDDESQWGNVSPAAAAFNQNIPGAGPIARPTPRAVTPKSLPAGPSADDRLRAKYGRPYQAPNVEQDSGVAYPQGRGVPNPYLNRQPSIMQRLFSQTPAEQAASFNQGTQARQNLGKRIGSFSLPNFNQALANLGRKAGGKVKKGCK